MKNKHIVKYLTLFVLLLSMVTKVNADTVNNTIVITDGYIKANVPGNMITAAYMTIKNNSDDTLTLEKVTSTISDKIEIHTHALVNDMMRMRKVNDITIAANDSVVLQPSGLHLMIFSLKNQLSEPQRAELTLHFSNNMKINIQLPVYKYK